MKVRYVIGTIIVTLSLLIAVQSFAAQKQVKLLTLEWEPYVGSNIPNKGFVTALITQAFEKAGYDVEIEFHTWDKAMEMARNGKADGIFPAYRDKSREEHFIFSKPFAKSYLELCKRRTFQSPSPSGGVADEKGYYIQYITDPRIDQTQALRDLKKYKFGVVKGYANTPEFDAADFLTKVQVASDKDNIAQLLSDEVQLIVIDRYVARNIMIKQFPWRSDGIEFLQPTLSSKDLYLAISKNTNNSEEKLKAFDAGLKILKEDGILDRIMRQYGF